MKRNEVLIQNYRILLNTTRNNVQCQELWYPYDGTDKRVNTLPGNIVEQSEFLV